MSINLLCGEAPLLERGRRIRVKQKTAGPKENVCQNPWDRFGMLRLRRRLYCETVIRTKDELHASNALSDEKWKNNPDINLNMISYLGFPLLRPDQKPFGTLCVLDKKPNQYSKTVEQLMQAFRSLIESHLVII
jgi:GAF domain-containing protein